jgi:uncharacterized protein
MKKLIDAHCHVVAGCKSLENLADKVKTRKDTFSLNSRHPEILQARTSEEPLDISSHYIDGMDRNGVSHAVIQQAMGTDSNELLAQTVKKYPDRFLGGLLRLPRLTRKRDRRPGDLPSEEELADNRAKAAHEISRGVEDLGLIGIGEFFRGNFTFETHPEKIARDLKPIMDAAAKYKVPIQVMTAYTMFPHDLFYGDPVWADEIAYSYPEVPVILTKMGRGTHHFETALSIAIRNSNVYFDMVETTPEHLRRAVDTIGAERIMYGSDWCPITRWVTEPTDVFSSNKRLLDQANLSSREREQIEWRTAASIFKVKLA